MRGSIAGMILGGAAVALGAIAMLPGGFFRGFFLAIGVTLLVVGGIRVVRVMRGKPDTGSRYIRTLRLNVDAGTALDLVHAALESDPEVRHVTLDRPRQRVTGRTGISFQSWGERITAMIRPEGEGASTVELSSAPRLPTTMVDYGRGRGHLKRIADALTDAPEPGDALHEARP